MFLDGLLFFSWYKAVLGLEMDWFLLSVES